MITSEASVVHVLVKHLCNFLPMEVFQVTTLCLHKVINHAPVGIGFHNELRETCESRVKHFGFVHETMIGYRFGVWGPGGTVPQLVSVTIQEVCERLLILFLSLESPQSDGAGVLMLGSGSVGEVTTLGEDLLSVRVGSGFVHNGSVARIGGKIKHPCATFPTGFFILNNECLLRMRTLHS